MLLESDSRRPGLDQRRFQLWMTAINGAVNIIKVAIIAGALVVIVGYAANVFMSFAGKNTNALIGIQLMTSIKIDRWIAYIFGIMGAGYGLRQRQLRRKAIERATARPIELEKSMDKKRSSSGLTTRGTTRPEDIQWKSLLALSPSAFR